MTNLAIIRSAIDVVRAYEARLFFDRCAELLHEQGHEESAIALVHAEVWWEGSGVIGIKCQTTTDAKAVRSQYQVLGQQAEIEGLRKILLAWTGCKYPSQISAQASRRA
jgi:hypothetical protein